MKTKTTLITLVLFLIGINLYSLYKLRITNSQISNSEKFIDRINNDYSKYSRIIDSVYYACMESEIRTDNIISAIASNHDVLNELGTGPKLILHYREGTCGSCVEKCLLDLEILANDIGRENILVTTNWNKDGRVMKNANFDFKQYYIETYSLPIEDVDTPVLFVLDSDFNVRFVYAAEVFPQIRSDYFFSLVPKYFDQLAI